MDPEPDDAAELEGDLTRLASPDQLDQVLTVVRPRVGVAVTASAVLALALVGWTFLGRIPIKISGNCIVMPQEGLFGVESEVSGIVRDVNIRAGQRVGQDEHLLTIADSQLLIRLESAEARVTKLSNLLEQLGRQIDIERSAEQEAIGKEIKAQESVVRELLDDINITSNRLAATRKLFAEGVVSRQQLETETQELQAKESRCESAKATLASLKSRSLRGYREEEYRTKELELMAARDEHSALVTQRERGIVRSPANGTVLEVRVSTGSFVTAGDSLAWLEHAGESNRSYRIYGYVPVDMGKLIAPGTEVLIDFPTFSSQNYGSLVGRVTEVSQFAVSPEHLLKVVKNRSLADYLVEGRSAVIQLIIRPEMAPGDPAVYRWVGGAAPPSPLTSGTVGSLKAIVKQVAPVTYILPAWGS